MWKFQMQSLSPSATKSIKLHLLNYLANISCTSGFLSQWKSTETSVVFTDFPVEKSYCIFSKKRHWNSSTFFYLRPLSHWDMIEISVNSHWFVVNFYTDSQRNQNWFISVIMKLYIHGGNWLGQDSEKCIQSWDIWAFRETFKCTWVKRIIIREIKNIPFVSVLGFKLWTFRIKIQNSNHCATTATICFTQL